MIGRKNLETDRMRCSVVKSLVQLDFFSWGGGGVESSKSGSYCHLAKVFNSATVVCHPPLTKSTVTHFKFIITFSRWLIASCGQTRTTCTIINHIPIHCQNSPLTSMSTQHQNNQHPTHNKDDAPLQQPPIFLHLNGGCLHLFLHLNGGCLHQMQPENDASQGGKKISPTNLKVCSSLLLFRCTVSIIHPFADVTCDLRCDVSYSFTYVHPFGVTSVHAH